MNKEFVTYEQALALKELGFDENTICVYNSFFHLKGCITSSINGDYIDRDEWDDRLAAPTCSQAFRWFREKYQIDSKVEKDYSLQDLPKQYCYVIDDKDGFEESINFNSYEEAESACLDKLIQIVKK